MKCDELKRETRDVDYGLGPIPVSFYDADKVDAAIAELKAKLEDVQASMYADVVDANMENRKLKRALYKAYANWAHFAVAFFSSYATKEKWRKMESKCLKKAEEYK